MEKRLMVLLILAWFGLSGCTGAGGMIDLDGNELANTATDRHTVWGEVEMKKVDAVIAIAAAETSKNTARIEEAKASATNTVITVNDSDADRAEMMLNAFDYALEWKISDHFRELEVP